MSKSKIERRKRRRRLAAEQARHRDFDADDLNDVDADEGSAAGSTVGAGDRPGMVQRAQDLWNRVLYPGASGGDDTASKRARSDDDARTTPDVPPLPLALGALLSIGFGANMILYGISTLSERPVIGAPALAFGIGLCVAAFFLFRRSYWGWLAVVIMLSLPTIVFVTAAVVVLNPAPLVFAVLPLLPLVLCLLPGVRAEVGAGRREADAGDE